MIIMGAVDFASLPKLALEWINVSESTLWYVGIISIMTFVGSLLLVPILIIKLPENYFLSAQRSTTGMKLKHPVLHFMMNTLKNMVGITLILCGVVMLVIPGQGLLTILLGFFLMDFPGKYHLEQRLVQQKKVLESLNWIRLRANKPKLNIPEKQDN
jgi:hypothetical protein